MDDLALSWELCRQPFNSQPNARYGPLSRFAVSEYPLAPTIDRSNDRSGHHFEIIARLKSGVTMTQTQAESKSMARRLKRQHGNDEEAVSAAVVGLREDLVGQTRPALLMLLAAVTLLLLVACVNVANLLLVRGAGGTRRLLSEAHWEPAAGASHASFSPRAFC